MTEFKEDKFVTKLIGFKSYIAHKKLLSKSFKKMKDLVSLNLILK